MRFRATEPQIRQLLATATNASLPAGLGFIHYDRKKVFTADDFAEGRKSVDYVQGRMVKLHVREVSPEVWEIQEPQFDPSDPERTYQSWGGAYPTARDLVVAAGLDPIEDAKS